MSTIYRHILLLLLLVAPLLALAQNDLEEWDDTDVVEEETEGYWDDNGDWQWGTPPEVYDGPTPTELYLEERIERKPIDMAIWRAASDGVDYTINPVPEEKKEEARQRTANNPNQPAPSGRSSRSSEPFKWGEAGAAIFKFLLVVGVLALIGYILARALGLKIAPQKERRRKRPRAVGGQQVDLAYIEENLQESDLDRAVRLAIEDQNHALAIRLYYLMAIKELSRLHLIKWKRDKTNRAYLRELQGHELRSPFRQLTQAFEWAWYGQRGVTQVEYQELKPLFTEFLERIPK